MRSLAGVIENNIEAEKVAAISIGIGPFVGDPRQKQRAQLALSRCGWISVRESVSLHELRALGIDRGMVHSDLCFVKELWADRAIPASAKSCESGSIGVVVRDWPHSQEGWSYFLPLCESVTLLRAEGFPVRYISFAGSYDFEVQKYLRERGEDLLVWDPYTCSPTDFAEQLLPFDVLVTSRAHGVVVGAALGIPSVAVEIEPKLRVIREGVEDGTAAWRSPFLVESLRQTVRKVVGNGGQLSTSVREGAAKCAESAKASLVNLRDWLIGG